MGMLSSPVLLAAIYRDLMKLKLTYSYMRQNAPTEEARRIVDLNLQTVKDSLDAIEGLHRIVADNATLPTETAMDVPIFATFMEAARYAFTIETQVISRANSLHNTIEDCHKHKVMTMLVEHQLNAMRLLYLDLF